LKRGRRKHREKEGQRNGKMTEKAMRERESESEREREME